MRKLSISTKVIIPVFIIAIFTSLISFYYINNILENLMNSEMQEKVQTKIKYTKSYIESEYKLFLGIHQFTEKVSKENTIQLLREENNNSKDILYIFTPKKDIQIGNLSLNKSQIQLVKTTNPFEIELNGIKYKVAKSRFSLWKWDIVLLLDASKFHDILYKNQSIIFSIVLILLGALFIILILIFNFNINQPINKLLKYLENVSNGKYEQINKTFDSMELDQLVSYINTMTLAVETREKDAKLLLEKTKESEDYILDILDSQENIILVYDKKEIQTANKSFFNLFKDFDNIETFKKDHNCICEYFIKGEGLIYNYEDKNWISYVLENKNHLHKVKIKQNDKEYIFALNVIKSQKYPRLIVSLTNISELEKSNTLLEEYKKAVDSAAIVSKTDKKGAITYVNDKFMNISGYTEEELIGKHHNILRSPNVPSSVFKDLWETITSKKIWHGEFENINKKGEPYYVAASIVPILDSEQNISEYIGIRYEITDQVIAKERALKAEQARGLFLANMSHEIRTPLNAIIGFTKILSNMTLEKKSSQYISIIDKSAQSLLGIVNDILDLSKIETNNLVLEKISFNPFEEFDSVINLFIAKVNEKNLEFVYFIDPKIPHKIIGDPLRLKQVLTNLISNAVKFTNTGFIKVRIELLSKEDNQCKIRFIIQDSGIGIKEEKQKQVFDAFSQADNSVSREFGGTGLGLSISTKIIQAYKTDIELESQEDVGSKFSFDIDFDVQSSQKDELSKYKKIKTAIYKNQNKDSLILPVLEEYLDLITLNSKINNKEIDEIPKHDIVFLDESSIDEIAYLNNSKTKFIVLSNSAKSFDKLNNYETLMLPINLSVLFDMLIESIDKKHIAPEENKNYTKYEAKILIVEDHEINQELISILLDFRGLSYEIANNGQEAIDCFKEDKYDMILMDINMPIKNGIDASLEIIEIEKEKNLTHTPIVILSANAIEGEKEKMLALGIDDYLYKPINENRLDEVLNEFLQTKEKDHTIILSPTSEKSTYKLEDASEKMGIPLSTIKTIIKRFMENINTDLSELDKAIENNDYENIRVLSHKIRGAALNFRMDEISKHSENIEKNYENKEFNFKEELEKLKLAISEVKKSIQAQA